MAGDPQRPYLQSPPDLPSIPDLDNKLADYLRRFALWSLGNFNSTVQKRTATGELYLRSTTGRTVWSLTVDDSGALHVTAVVPGGQRARAPSS